MERMHSMGSMESIESIESTESTEKINIDNLKGIVIGGKMGSTEIKDMNDLDYKYSTRYIQSY